MSDPARTHVGMMTQSLKGIPTEKLQKKVGRTIAGLVLILAALKGGPWLKAADIAHAREIATVALILGAVMCSFEFVVAPVRFLIAVAKDGVNIVTAFLTRKKANGDGNGESS